MTRPTRRLFAAAVAVAVSGTVVFGAAAPALADTDELWTGNARWFDIDSDEPYVGDAESAYIDLLGSGVDLPYGWTGDLFDGALFDWTVTDGVTTDSISWAGVSESVDAGGVSQWNYAGTVAAFPAATFTATLELAGSTVRWVITPTGTASGLVVGATGDLGSDGNETVAVVTPNSAVVSSDDLWRDPVIGYWFSAPSGVLSLASGDGDVSFSFVDSGPATVVIAAQDYAGCSKQTAIDEMTALVPTLGSQFGVSIEGALECLTVTAPTSLAVGAATSQTLALTLDPAIVPFLASSNSFSLESGVLTYFGDPTLVGSAVVGLPSGLSGTIDPATQTLLLSGTPTQAGTFAASAIVYRTDVRDYWFGDVGNGIPLVADFTVTVGAPAPAAALPPTGLDAGTAPLVFVAGLLVTGGLALARAARVRRAD